MRGTLAKNLGVFSFQKWVAGRVMAGDGHFSVPGPVVLCVHGALCPSAWHAVAALPGDAAGLGLSAGSIPLPPPPEHRSCWRHLVRAAFSCARIRDRENGFVRKLGEWELKRGWKGRKTLAFHSSFSQFILRDQLHAIRQLGVLFSFQLCTVGEAGKVIFFFLVLLFHDAIVIALSKRVSGEEGKLVNDAEGPCIVSALYSCSLGRGTVYSAGAAFCWTTLLLFFQSCLSLSFGKVRKINK